MRIEQVGIEVSGGVLILRQDDHGFGEQSIAFPIKQWDYIRRCVEEIIKEEGEGVSDV